MYGFSIINLIRPFLNDTDGPRSKILGVEPGRLDGPLLAYTVKIGLEDLEMALEDA